MEEFEVKTPLRAPNKYRKDKKKADDARVEDFMSFGSSNFFNINDDDDFLDTFGSGNKVSIQAERSIEEWLLSNNIFKSTVSEKKEGFFQVKRDRVNSISYFDHNLENQSTDISPVNNSKSLTPQSLTLTPTESKIYKKRIDFSSMADIKMDSSFKHSSGVKSHSRFKDMHLKEIQSEQKKVNPVEEIEHECLSDRSFNRIHSLEECPQY